MLTKKICLLSTILFISSSFIVKAQNLFSNPQLQVAYINSLELLNAIPEKVEATKRIESLNRKYKKELATMQNDYNSKYTAFLSEQNELAESIKLRRMQELYELEQNINKFMKIAQEDIDSQEIQQINPLREKLKIAIEEVGVERGFVCIFDMANPAISFVTPNAIDANSLVKEKLFLKTKK